MNDYELYRTASAAVQKLAALCRNGQRLCLGKRQANDGFSDSWFLEPSGKTVRVDTARKAVTSGLFVPSDDCLFDDGEAQTYVTRWGGIVMNALSEWLGDIVAIIAIAAFIAVLCLLADHAGSLITAWRLS